MSNSINDRISRLRSRRSGLDRSSLIAMDAKDFIVKMSLRISENGALIFARDWDERIARDHM